MQKHPQCLRRRAAEQFSCFIYNIFTSAVCTDKHTQTRIGINSAPVSPFLRGQLRKNAKVCCRVSDHSLSSWLTSYRHITWVITYRNGIEERSEKGNKHRDRDHLSCVRRRQLLCTALDTDREGHNDVPHKPLLASPVQSEVVVVVCRYAAVTGVRGYRETGLIASSHSALFTRRHRPGVLKPFHSGIRIWRARIWRVPYDTLNLSKTLVLKLFLLCTS